MAHDLAVAEGVRRERVDNRLDGHESRLNALNGNLSRAGDNLEDLKRSLSAVSVKVDSVVAQLVTRDAVAEALKDAVQEANEKQISTKTFALGVFALLIPLIVLLVSLGGHG